MAESEQIQDQLLVAVREDTAFVYVCGRGTFKISSALKQFGLAALEQGSRRIVLNMEACIGMDSTFMGVLAGLAAKLKEKNGGTIVVVNLSARTRGLLATLGLDQVVEAHMAGSTPEDVAPYLAPVGDLCKLPSCKESRRAAAETMLEAHENLVGISAENYPRFKDVLTFLREDIEKSEEKNPR